MKYELAKQLKEAGFPLREPYCDCSTIWNSNERYEKHLETAHFEEIKPTLEEVIEELGSRVVLHSPFSLDVNEEYYQHNEYWTAYKQGVDKDKFPKSYGTISAEGKTPRTRSIYISRQK